MQVKCIQTRTCLYCLDPYHPGCCTFFAADLYRSNTDLPQINSMPQMQLSSCWQNWQNQGTTCVSNSSLHEDRSTDLVEHRFLDACQQSNVSQDCVQHSLTQPWPETLDYAIDGRHLGRGTRRGNLSWSFEDVAHQDPDVNAGELCNNEQSIHSRQHQTSWQIVFSSLLLFLLCISCK